MNLRDALVALGIAIAIGGIAMVVDPGLAAFVPGPRLLVIVAGVGILFQGVRIARTRRKTEFSETETSNFEASLRVPTPGDEIDDILAQTRVVSFADTRGRSSAQDDAYRELRSVAIDTITHRMGCSEGEAAEMLEAGTWTEDPRAAAFFGASQDSKRRSILDTLRQVGKNEAQFQRRFRHATEALRRLAEGELEREPERNGEADHE